MIQAAYLEKLKNPNHWFKYALNQKYVGDQILENCIMDKKEVLLSVKEDNSVFVTLWANVHFHYGIGIENGFKGLVAKYNPDKNKYKIDGEEIILEYIGGNPGKRHDLLQLAESIGIFSDLYNLFQYESDDKVFRIVLQHLSDTIKWGARYPLPNRSKKYFVFDRSIPSRLVYGFHILDVIEPIFQLFEREMATNKYLE